MAGACAADRRRRVPLAGRPRRPLPERRRRRRAARWGVGGIRVAMRARHRATPPRAVRGLTDSLRRLDRRVMRRAHRIELAASRPCAGVDHDGRQLLAAVARDRGAAGAAAADPGGRAAAGRGLLALVIAGVTTNGPAKLLARRRRPASASRADADQDAALERPSPPATAPRPSPSRRARPWSCRRSRPCSRRSRWRSATRACTRECTTRATWPPAPPSESARRRWHEPGPAPLTRPSRPAAG